LGNKIEGWLAQYHQIQQIQITINHQASLHPRQHSRAVPLGVAVPLALAGVALALVAVALKMVCLAVCAALNLLSPTTLPHFVLSLRRVGQTLKSGGVKLRTLP
jgi:hypothetical protein